jgi:hypothetical protein
MTDPITPSTVQHVAVTVSAPNERGDCRVTYADGSTYWPTYIVKRRGLTVPEHAEIACTIGDIEYTLTREQVEAIAKWKTLKHLHPHEHTIADAARRWVDGQEDR